MCATAYNVCLYLSIATDRPFNAYKYRCMCIIFVRLIYMEPNICAQTKTSKHNKLVKSKMKPVTGAVTETTTRRPKWKRNKITEEKKISNKQTENKTKKDTHTE